MNAIINKKTTVTNLGLIDYKQAWDYQGALFEKILAIKAANRERAEADQQPTENHLLFCQHPHVYTLGKTGKEDHLLVKLDDLKDIEAQYYHINRGGDITYHGPGQIVGYPVIDLENFFTDIHKYMRVLEEAVIQTVGEYGLAAGRIQGLTGVWIDHEKGTRARKICAFGVKTSRWVAMHGLALNVNPDLNYFNNIVACGISDRGVTSLEKELGRPVELLEVQQVLQNRLVSLFDMEVIREVADR